MQASDSPQPASEPTEVVCCFAKFAEDHFDDFKKAGKTSNPTKFHECCFTFSTKKLRSRLGHPAERAVTFRRLLEQNKIHTQEEFADLLRRLSAARTDDKVGQVPTWNERHQEELDLGKREPRPAQPDPSAEVEELRRQLAREQATVQALQQQNQALEQQLEHDRTAALHHERRYLRNTFRLRVATCYLKKYNLNIAWDSYSSISNRLAQGFQAAHPNRLTFDSIPPPQSAQHPAPPRPADPDYVEIDEQFDQYARTAPIDDLPN